MHRSDHRALKNEKKKKGAKSSPGGACACTPAGVKGQAGVEATSPAAATVTVGSDPLHRRLDGG